MEYNSILYRERLTQFLEIFPLFTISDDFECPILIPDLREHLNKQDNILESCESSDESDFWNGIVLSLNLREIKSTIDNLDIFSSKCF